MCMVKVMDISPNKYEEAFLLCALNHIQFMVLCPPSLATQKFAVTIRPTHRL